VFGGGGGRVCEYVCVCVCGDIQELEVHVFVWWLRQSGGESIVEIGALLTTAGEDLAALSGRVFQSPIYISEL
jgi:hypothetical protein